MCIFYRPGVLKDPQIMSGVWLVIFYIVCLILARQVCVCVQMFTQYVFKEGVCLSILSKCV